MQLSVTAIAGLGGVKLSKEHVEGTAKALSAMNPEYVGVLTLEVHEDTPLEQWTRDGSFTLLDAVEVLKEARELISLMDCPGCVFRMNHASNYLTLKGTLNGDKEALIRKIDEALSGNIDLRPEWARGF